jgi:hypothetical protein
VGQNPGMAVYRQPRAQTALLPVFFLALGAFAVFLTVTTLRGGEGPGVWFLVAFVGAWLWNAYWFLLRVCTEVEVDDRTVRWRTPLRRGSVPVGAVRSVRPSRFGSQLAVVDLDGAPSLYVIVRYGFAGLTDALRAAAPHADIRGA